jgi:hypothetical protein
VWRSHWCGKLASLDLCWDGFDFEEFPEGALPKGGDRLGSDLFVAGDEGHLFDARLSDEETVEGVFME